MRKMRKSISLLLAMLMIISMMPVGIVGLFQLPAIDADAAEVTDDTSTTDVAIPDTTGADDTTTLTDKSTEATETTTDDTTEDTESTYTWAFDASTGTLTISGTGVVNVELAKTFVPEESTGETETTTATDTGTESDSSETTSETTTETDGSTDSETTEYPDIVSMLPWGEHIKDIKHVVVEEGITGLGDGALAYLINMEIISLPSTLVTVGMGVFMAALSLKELIIPEGVTSVDELGLCTLVSLETLVLPDSLQLLYGVCDMDFSYSLINVTLPACIESMEDMVLPFIEKLNNKSLTAAYDSGNWNDAIYFTEEYRYFKQLYNEMYYRTLVEEILSGATFDSIDEVIMQKVCAKFNARFGTTIQDFNDFDVLFNNVKLLTPISTDCTIYCYENSAQHTMCEKNYDKHVLYETGTECTDCLNFSGVSTDDNSNTFTWTVDPAARTLTVNGTGEMEFDTDNNLPGWYACSDYYDTVNVGEGITSFNGLDAFGKFDEINLPSTIEVIEPTTIGGTGVKDVNLPADGIKFDNRVAARIPIFGDTIENDVYYTYTLFSMDGVVYVEYSDEMLKSSEYKEYLDVDEIDGDLGLVYYPEGRTEFNISERVMCICDYSLYWSYTNQITLSDKVLIVGEAAIMTHAMAYLLYHSDHSAKVYITVLNKDCKFYDSSVYGDDDFVIYGYHGSTAQTYAEKNGNTFIPLDECDFSAEWTVDTEPTCTTEGSKSHHCSRCSEKSDVTVIPASGHTYGEFVIVTEPTCTEKGLKQKTCSICGDIVKEEIDALGHDFSTEWTVDTEPTWLCQ